MARLTLEQAYPALRFRPRSRNWWARLAGTPAECIHLDTGQDWMATLVPDTLYLRGKGRTLRTPARPDVSLCRECLLGVLEPELAAHAGRVVAFEPDVKIFSQYFFVAAPEMEAAGLRAEVAAAIAQRLRKISGSCEQCSRRASWLWLSHEEVPSLDDVVGIASSPGRLLCASHGAPSLRRCFLAMAEANVYYINAPYGDAGAYLWI